MNEMSHPSVTDKTICNRTREVEEILALYKEGKNIIEIASMLGFAQSYIQDVLLCAQTLAEEDPVAIAMLMEDS